MGDYHIHMRFLVNTGREELHRLLGTAEGVSSWWSDSVEGSLGAAGNRFQVSFPDAPAPFQFEVRSAGPDRYEWHVPDMPEWWAGTTIRFDLADSDQDGTELMFSHRDFEPDHPVIPIVTPAWAMIVDNLRKVAESGGANPYFVNA